MEKIVQNTVADMVDTKIVNKIAESERELANRQSTQKNVIIFKAKESNTNLTHEGPSIEILHTKIIFHKIPSILGIHMN